MIKDGMLELIENARGLLEPYNTHDLRLFMHCTDGAEAITYCHFQDLQTVFAVHGWTLFKRCRDVDGNRVWEFIQ